MKARVAYRRINQKALTSLPELLKFYKDSHRRYDNTCPDFSTSVLFSQVTLGKNVTIWFEFVCVVLRGLKIWSTVLHVYINAIEDFEMTVNYQMPQAKNMTPQAETILQKLRMNGGWMTRSEIAAALGRKRINVWTVAVLDMLVEQGLVAVEKRDAHGGIGFAWSYKAVIPDSQQ
jgi:predicted transcriptional regulator